MATSSKLRGIPRLPSLLERKIYKTGQTRGADDDEIFQNRVSRTSTVLIPFSQFDSVMEAAKQRPPFENGYIVLVNPIDYFTRSPSVFESRGLRIGDNLLIFYETREQWEAFNPVTKRLVPASSRRPPLNGHFVARVPATTAAEGGQKIVAGFNETSSKGAGIRVYEYADPKTIEAVRLQLEALFWHCEDSLDTVSEYGMRESAAKTRKDAVTSIASESGLLDYAALQKSRTVGQDRHTMCPLCLEAFSSRGFFSRMEQAPGREVVDLTVTQLNLFHIRELRYGEFNHRPYNVGWGHHHCNIVVRDSGIQATLLWMSEVLERNRRAGLLGR